MTSPRDLIKKYPLARLPEMAWQIRQESCFSYDSCQAADMFTPRELYHLFLVREMALYWQEDSLHTLEAKAAERAILSLASDAQTPVELQKAYFPDPIKGSSGGGFLLKSCKPEILLNGKLPPPEELFFSSVYKPQHMALGGLDAKPLYMDEATTLFYEMRLREGAACLEALDPFWKMDDSDSFPVEYLACPPDIISSGGQIYKRVLRMRRSIAPDDGIYKTTLFKTLIEYLNQALKSFTELPINTFAYPATSIEALCHPAFGKNHRIGSRHAYIPHSRSLHDLYLETKTDKPFREVLSKLQQTEIYKISIPQILAVNLDATLGNILLQGHALWQIDATYTFPEFIGPSKSDLPIQAWAMFKQTGLPYNDVWRRFIKSLDLENIISLLKDCDSWLKKRFHMKKPAFSELAECSFRAAFTLLQAGAEKNIPLNHLAAFQYPLPLYDKKGDKRKDEDGKVIMRGGEFWHVVQLALIAQNNITGDPILFTEFTKSCQTYFQNLMDRIDFIRSAHPIADEIIKTNDPLNFLLALIDGRFDPLRKAIAF